jgi:1-phosphofructokinase
VLLSGPADDAILPDDVYRRLAADLDAAERPVVVDLAGSRLLAALDGGVELAKVSDSELRDMGWVHGGSIAELVDAAQRMRDAGARNVVVTRAGHPTLLIDGQEAVSVQVAEMEEVDSTGAGDSFIAALVAGLVDGEVLRDAVELGAAAGALNVTRHGLGTGDPEAIRRLRERVVVQPVVTDESGAISPGQLAARAEVDDG